MNRIKIPLLIVSLTLVSLPALAQRSFRDAPRGPYTQEQRDEIRKKIEAIRIWRMTEELKLDADTSAKLASLLSPIEQKRREIIRERIETMRNLREILKAEKPEEAKIKPLLNRLENNHRALQELKNAESKGIKEILTIEQQARFLIFQREFEREMRETIAQARGGRHRGDGPEAFRPDRRNFQDPGGPKSGPEGPATAP